MGEGPLREHSAGCPPARAHGPTVSVSQASPVSLQRSFLRWRWCSVAPGDSASTRLPPLYTWDMKPLGHRQVSDIPKASGATPSPCTRGAGTEGLSLTHTRFEPFPRLFFFVRPSHYSNHFAFLSAGEPTPETKESLAGRSLQQPLPSREVAGGLEAAERGQKAHIQPWGESFENRTKSKLLFPGGHHGGVCKAPLPSIPKSLGLSPTGPFSCIFSRDSPPSWLRIWLP